VESKAGSIDVSDVEPIELAERLARGERVQLVDVREPHEHAHARIDGARLIPLRTLPARAAELDPGAETIVYCHHGVRSAQAVDYLRGLGFRQARNLTGGIDAWSVDVDSRVKRY
jgi:rhodanese-related sulfurtransferase